ncbi:MAG: SIS domain-containing protein [Actinomycetota bacterium]
MESLGRFPDPFLEEIAAQPAAIRRAAGALRAQIDPLERLARIVADPARPRRSAVFTGMGASYAACYAPVTVLAGLGVQASMVDAAELLHFRRGLLSRDTVVVIVSQSGRSAEAVRLVAELDSSAGPTVVAVTNGPDNPLALSAKVALDTHAGAEVGPSTLSFGASVVVLAAVADVLAGRPVSSALTTAEANAGAAACSAEGLLDEPAASADRFRAWFDDRPAVVLLGRGAARAASEVGALVLKEAARVPAEALESAQFRHGPLELAGRDLAAAVVAIEPATEDLDRALAAELAAAGGSVLVIGRTATGEAGEREVMIGQVDRALAPSVAVVPFQLLAWRVAVDRGFSPGMLQIASKVTTRE